MKIFVIHNPNNQERTENIKTQFKTQIGDQEYELMPAIMDSGMPRRGISQSHKACVRKAKELGLPEVCIMEDDILFTSSTSLGLFKLTYHIFKISMLPENWDLFFGGIYAGDLKEMYYGINENKICRVEGNVSGLHLYVINENFYDKFLCADERYNLDYYLSYILKAQSYCVSPFLAIQGNFESASGNNMSEINEKLTLKYKLFDGKSDPTPSNFEI